MIGYYPNNPHTPHLLRFARHPGDITAGQPDDRHRHRHLGLHPNPGCYPLLLTSFFNELPGMAFGSLAGVLVDRWNRRRVIMLAEAGQAVGSLILLWSFASGSFQLWHLYVVEFVQGVFASLQDPAQAAAVTMLVPVDRRERANAMREMVFPLAGVAAPVAAGFAYALSRVAGVIAVDLASFAIALLVLAIIRIPQPTFTPEGQAGRGHPLNKLAVAWRFLLRKRALLYLILYLSFIYFMLNGPLGLTIPYLLLKSADECLLGAVMGLMSLGAFSGALIVAVFGRLRPRLPYVLGGYILGGLMFLVYGMAYNPWLLAASLFILMIPLPACGALSNSIFQVKVPPDMLGRVFAVYNQFALLASTTSFLITGYLADRILEPAVGSPAWMHASRLVGNTPGAGIGLIQVVTGILILLPTLAVWIWPLFRNLEVDLPDYQTEETPDSAQ